MEERDKKLNENFDTRTNKRRTTTDSDCDWDCDCDSDTQQLLLYWNTEGSTASECYYCLPDCLPASRVYKWMDVEIHWMNEQMNDDWRTPE